MYVNVCTSSFCACAHLLQFSTDVISIMFVCVFYYNLLDSTKRTKTEAADYCVPMPPSATRKPALPPQTLLQTSINTQNKRRRIDNPYSSVSISLSHIHCFALLKSRSVFFR